MGKVPLLQDKLNAHILFCPIGKEKEMVSTIQNLQPISGHRNIILMA